MIAAAPRRGLARLPSWLPAAGVGMVTLAIALVTVTPYVIGAYHDDAIYVILGRALATGAGYRYLNLPGVPSATHYPPGYPALLALLWRLDPHFPGNVAVFEMANAVLLALAAVLAYGLARARMGLSTWWAALIALLGTVTIPPLALAGMVLSETLGLAVLLGALVVADRVATRPTENGRASSGTASNTPAADVTGPPECAWSAAAAAGVLCGLVALVRTAEFVVIPALVAACAWRGHRRSGLIAGVGGLAVVLPWQFWVWRHGADLAPILQGEYGSYAGWLAGALGRHGLGFALGTAGRNAAAIASMLGAQMAPRMPAAVKWLAVAGSVGLVTVGVPRLVRMAPVTAGFIALYALEVVFWPFPPFRFVWAGWIFFVLTLVMGTVTLVEWRPRALAASRARRIALVGAVLIGVAIVRYNVFGYRGHWWGTMQASLSAREARPLGWLAQHSTPEGVVVSDEEPAVYLYTGRTGVPCNAFRADDYIYPRDTARDRAVLAAVLQRFPVGAVIATGPACALAALRLSQTRPASLAAIDTSQAGLAVFERLHP